MIDWRNDDPSESVDNWRRKLQFFFVGLEEARQNESNLFCAFGVRVLQDFGHCIGGRQADTVDWVDDVLQEVCGQLRITRKLNCVPEVFSKGLVFAKRVKLGNPNSSNLKTHG